MADTSLIIAILGSGGVGAALTALIKLPSDRNKSMADTAGSIVVMADSVAKSLREDNKQLRIDFESKADELEQAHIDCEDRYTELLKLVRKIDERKSPDPLADERNGKSKS